MKLFTQQATLTTPSVSVYEKADSSSTTVGHLILGNTFDLEETLTAEDDSTWYRVTLPNGIEGYIQGEFTTGQEQQPEKTTENGTYVQTLVSANVRAEADINSANIGKVDVHQKISVLDEVQDVNGESWYLIEGDFDGASQGYIKASTAEIVTTETAAGRENENAAEEEQIPETETAHTTVHKNVNEDSLDGSHELLAQTTTETMTGEMAETAKSGLFSIDYLLLLVILMGIAAFFTAQRIFHKMLREIFGRKLKSHDRKRRIK